MPKRSPASSALAEDAPPVLDDVAVATLPPPTMEPTMDEPPPSTDDEFAVFHSQEWKGLDAVIVRIIDGTATVEDVDTAHRSGFIRETLEREIVRIKRVADQRQRAVSMRRLQEMERIAHDTECLAAIEIGKERQRFLELKAAHEAKIAAIENERASTKRAFEAAQAATMQLRSLVPEAVAVVWKRKAQSVESSIGRKEAELRGRIELYERVSGMECVTEDGREQVRLGSLARHNPLFNESLYYPVKDVGGTHHYFNYEAGAKWLAEVQAKIARELPAMKDEHAKLAAERNAAETEVRGLLDYYLPVD